MSEKLNLFIPIVKVDSARRLVYGTLTEEITDKSGEIIDYETTKAAYQKWSGDVSKATGGKSKGNLRAMHGNVAAGRFDEISFDDAAKKIHGVAHVVDDNEWKKVEEGVYTGFSHGGSYAKRWNDPSDPTRKRYTPTLAEVSLVDYPCLHTATFEFIKRDGSCELRKFNHQEDTMKKQDTKDGAAQGETVADQTLNKAEGETTETGQPAGTEGEIVPGYQAKDGSFHMEKADALSRNQQVEVEAAAQPAMNALKKLDAALTKAEGGKSDDEPETAKGQEGEPEAGAAGETDGEKAGDIAQKSAADSMKKGMYSVSALASLLADLNCLRTDAAWEAEYEGDGSAVPEKLKVCINSLAEVLKEMVGEETAELTAEKAAKGGDLAKKGASLSAASKAHIDKMHKSAQDHMTTMNEGRKALGMDEGDDANKGASDTMAKRADDGTAAERDALKKVLETMTPQIEGLVKRIDELERQPMPVKGSIRVVEKANDGSKDSDGDVVKKFSEHMSALPKEEQNTLLMKFAMANPVKVLP